MHKSLQSYEKSRALQRNLFLFLLRWSKFAIFDGKDLAKSMRRPSVERRKIEGNTKKLSVSALFDRKLNVERRGDIVLNGCSDTVTQFGIVVEVIWQFGLYQRLLPI